MVNPFFIHHRAAHGSIFGPEWNQFPMELIEHIGISLSDDGKDLLAGRDIEIGGKLTSRSVYGEVLFKLLNISISYESAAHAMAL